MLVIFYAFADLNCLYGAHFTAFLCLPFVLTRARALNMKAAMQIFLL